MTPRIDPLELPPPSNQKELRVLLREEQRKNKQENWDRRVTVYGRRASDIANYCYTGVLKVGQFPFYLFDLLDGRGRPDHTKIGPFIVSQELVALCAWDVIVNKNALQAFIVTIIAVLSFASMSLMRKFLDKNTSSVTASSSVSLEKKESVSVDIKKIIEERNIFDGSPPRSLPEVGAVEPE